MEEIYILKRGIEKIEMEILTELFVRKILRSNHLVEKISAICKVSAPAVYSRLKILEETGLVKKIEISARNVQYELTLKGNDIATEKHQVSRERLLTLLRGLPDPRGFVINILLEDILDKLPTKWRLMKNKQMLKEMLIKDLDFRMEQIIKIINYNPIS